MQKLSGVHASSWRLTAILPLRRKGRGWGDVCENPCSPSGNSSDQGASPSGPGLPWEPTDGPPKPSIAIWASGLEVDPFHAHHIQVGKWCLCCFEQLPYRVSILLAHQSVRITEKHYAPWVRSRQNNWKRIWLTPGAAIRSSFAKWGTAEVHGKQRPNNSFIFN
jgi:hypothetical protein